MKIRDSRDEPYFTSKIKSLSSQIKINTLCKNINGRKIRRQDKNTHKAMLSPVEIYLITKEFFVTVHPKNTFKLEFSYNLWLAFIDQPHYDILVFAVINFHMYKILVKK